jgi:hypothetical protein
MVAAFVFDLYFREQVEQTTLATLACADLLNEHF